MLSFLTLTQELVKARVSPVVGATDCRSPDVVTTIASKFVIVVVLLTFSAALFLHSQQVEATSRLDFLWKLQVCATLDQALETTAYTFHETWFHA